MEDRVTDQEFIDYVEGRLKEERRFNDERQEHTMRLLGSIEKKVDALSGRLNWFYILMIGSLATAVLAALGLK